MNLVFASLLYAYCAVNSGLNPACPLTQAGVEVSNTTLNEGASSRSDTLFGSLAIGGDQQWSASLPVYERLSVSGEGDAYGMGDFDFGYARVFVYKRFAQTVGLSAELATGATAFSNGRTQLTPSYAASYAVGDRISLVAIAQYTFGAGGTKQPFAPQTRSFTVVPRAIVDLSKRGLYMAAELQGWNVTGDERYQAYAADATLGIARPHYNFAVTYGVPIARYTYDHVFYHTLGVQLSWRP
jgi:hypothetical protein